MAELIESNEAFFTAFEPKQQNRYILFIDGIPSFMIKEISRPVLAQGEVELPHINLTRWVKGKSVWDAATLNLYDPITPSGAQTVMEWVRLHHESVTGRDGYADFYKKDLTLNVLGPVGDKVEEWTYKGAWITNADFGSLAFANVDTITDINLSIRYDYCILQF